MIHRFPKKCLAVLLACAAPSVSAERNDDWKSLYEALRSPQVADSGWTLTDSVSLRLPDFSVDMHSGQIVPLHGQSGITGWLFEGEGRARFAPRHHLEQQQLRRFITDTLLVCSIRRLVLRHSAKSSLFEAIGDDGSKPSPSPFRPFSHSPVPFPFGSLKKSAAVLSDETLQLNERLQSQLLLRGGYNLPARLLVDHLSENNGALAIGAFTPSSADDLSPPLYIYSFDPVAREPARFYQSFEQRSGSPFYALCSYSLKDLYAVPSDSIQPTPPNITKYNGWVEARTSGDIWVDMGCDIFLNRQPLPFLQLNVAREFSVQMIRDEQGDTLAFIQEPGESAFTILEPAANPLDTLRLLISYQGRALTKTAAGDYYLQDPLYWLPRLGYLQRAIHKIIVKYPGGMRLVGIGKASIPPGRGDSSFNLKYLNADTPARAFAFAFGRFVMDSLTVDDGLKVQIFSTQAHTGKARQTVLADVKASLKFFQSRLGPYPLPQLDVLEAPSIESQGLPGLVMLTWVSFRSNVAGVMEMLRGHEVAHQWFGNTVGWATYHDQWLSESITEYLGATFMQQESDGEKYFTQVLNAWRDDLLSSRPLLASAALQRFGLPRSALMKSEGRTAGPIWMGIRLGEKHGVDYYLQTYEKGAWVMHMLRRLLTDDAPGSDAAFWKMLADFYASFAHKDPTTFDFQKIVERHAGMPMDWFFKQWILGTEIPSYEWKARTEKIGKDDFGVRGMVRQKGTSPDFRMPVPIAFEFGNNQRRIERVWVTGSETTFEFRFSQKPKKIIFNYAMAVLCEEKKMD
jgi:hypothetical protein